MSEQAHDEMNDYRDKLEQHELLKREGAAAWADAVADMLPHADPDKRLLIKEGLKALMGGPPSFPLPTSTAFMMPTPPMEPPVPHIFEQAAENGDVTVWDWHCLASRGTHSTRYSADGTVRIWKGDDVVIDLKGEAAAKFWEWKSDALKRYAGFPGPFVARPL